MRSQHWLKQFGKVSIPHQFVLGLLLLLAASYVGNLARVTLFFDIDFIFGSIAVWLVVCLYGIRWGTLAGFVSGLCTYFLWHHPYTVITFTCEALFVGLLFHRNRQNLVLLNGIFWLLIGMPLVWLFYAVFLQVDPVQVQIVLLKQPINGIFNALIASLLLTYLPIHRWVDRPQAVSTLSFQQTLFNLLVAFVFLPTLLLIVLASRDVVGTIKTSAQADLSRVSSQTAAEIRSWYQEHRRSVYEIARQMTDPEARFNQLQQQVESTQRLLPDFASLTVVAADATTVLASTSTGARGAIAPTPRNIALESGRSFMRAANQPYLQRAKQTLQPVFSDVLLGSAPAHIIWNVPIVQGSGLQGFIVGELTLDEVNALLQHKGDGAQIAMTLMGRSQLVMASTQPGRMPGQTFDRRRDGELQWLDSDSNAYQWFSTQGSQLNMVRWMNSFFVQETIVAPDLPWTLIAELSAMPGVRDIQKIYARNLAIILAIAVLALIFSALISRQLVRPLSQLAVVTTNLPTKLLSRQAIDWTDSQITEIAFLVQNFRTMAATLTQQFRELQQALDYEALVKRITDKVRDNLDEDQILQTAVQELGQGIAVICCDAALYNAEQTLSTISYEYTTLLVSAQGQTFQMPDQFPGIHSALLQGEYRQFCFLQSHPARQVGKQAAIFACPIVDDQEVLGDLWLFKRREAVFSTSEIRLVQQVANQCAIALRQARLYQAAQVQVKALEALNELKDDFLSTISHELRTPITNIKMAIRMLQLAEREEQRIRYVKILQQECDREVNLINDLLDLQRLASGSQVLNLEPIHLQAWVTQIVEAFQERTRSHQQTLQIEIPSELPVITSDSACLERILTELLNNACKYTPPGERIKVSARTVNSTSTQVDASAKANMPFISSESLFVLDVCNSGVEIPADELEHIFEKFYRVPGGDRWKQGGTGLGLALVQKMTARLGGSIHVESAAQKTCFRVELPVILESY